MDITEQKVAETLTVAVAGRLDAATSKTFEEYLLKKIDDGERQIVLDLARLDFISSVGLRVFMMATKRLKVVQGRIVVCSLQRPIEQVFKISGFDTLFLICGTVDEALTSIR